MALGGICGNLFGGYTLSIFQMNTIFLLFSVMPTIQLLSCGFVADNSISSSQLPEFSTSNETDIDIFDEGRLSAESPSPPKPGTLMRKRSHKSSKKILFNISKYQEIEKDESLTSQWFQSFKRAGYTLFKAFQRPIILRYNLINFIFHVVKMPYCLVSIKAHMHKFRQNSAKNRSEQV